MSTFKPGDVVRTKGGDVTVLKQCDDVLHFIDGDWGYTDDFEHVSPAVPVSKIREVFETKLPHCTLGGRLLLRHMFYVLTGESLTMGESP